MKAIKLFISYSHQDEKYKDQLLVHLSALKRRGIIEEWHDRELITGQEWDGKIKQELLDSDIIILLISSDFIASNYCYETEITKAIEMHDQGNAFVIPIILRPCDWKDLPFSKIQGLPKDAKPLSTWYDIDEGFVDVINGIKRLAERNFSKPKVLSDTINTEKTITFPYDVIIGRLPRGYVVIEDIEIKEIPSWAVIIHYYDYEGNLNYGTHYHESYHNRWESPLGMEGQCKKLMIPKGDWNYAESALYLTMELRERNKNDNFDKILNHYKSDYDFFNYYKKDQEILVPTVPDEFIQFNKTGEIRDIIEDLRIDPWKNYEITTLKEDFESIRRKAYLILYEKLGKEHPALSFVKEIVDEFKTDFNLEDLRVWSRKLSDSLSDSYKYL